eukprot:4122249-Prymnesium_polylepis.1
MCPEANRTRDPLFTRFRQFYHKFLASEKVRAKFSQKAVEKMTSLEQKQRARDLFAANDKDGSGQLDEKELSALLRQMLADVTAQMDDAAWTAFVQDVIVRGDKDTNAQWSADECGGPRVRPRAAVQPRSRATAHGRGTRTRHPTRRCAALLG